MNMQWSSIKLAELTDYRNGLWAGKTGAFARAKVVRVTEMRDDGGYDLSTAKELQVEERKLGTRRVVPNSILLERSGGGDNKPVGRVVIFADDVADDTYSFSNFTTLLLPKTELINPKYLFYALYFFHLSGKTKLLQKAVTGIRNLDFTTYLAQEIQLPFKDGKSDLAEQKRIADKLDKVFEKIGEGSKKATEQSDFATLLRQSLLSKTFSRAEWQTLPIQALVDIHDSKRIPLNSTERSKMQGEYPYLGANGVVDYINKYLFDGEYLLVAEDGGFFKKFEKSCYLFSGKFWVNNHAHILSAKPDVTINKWLYYYFLFADMAQYCSGATRLKLTQAKLRSIPIPLPFRGGKPDIAEQRRIVGELDKAFSLAERLEALATKQELSFSQLRISSLNTLLQSQEAVAPVSAPVVSPLQIVAAPRMFDIQQAVAHILKRFERGEMVTAKVIYIGQTLFGVPTNIQFSAQNFGPYDAAVKKAVTAGLSPKNRFFAKKGTGTNQVLTLGANANKILKYSTSTLARKTNAYLDQMLPFFKQSDSAGIERLATLCKIIEDEQTTDEVVVKAKLQEWKPNKFTDEDVSRTLAFIVKEGWDKKLLKNEYAVL